MHRQLSFDLYQDLGTPSSPEISAATENLSKSTGAESLGAIFTRPEVVDFILDLAGYTEDKALHKKRLLEPSFGAGDFLVPIVKRLLSAWREVEGTLDDLTNAIYAVELHRETYEKTHAIVLDFLQQEGFSAKTANALLKCWLLQGDFLLVPLKGEFDFGHLD